MVAEVVEDDQVLHLAVLGDLLEDVLVEVLELQRGHTGGSKGGGLLAAAPPTRTESWISRSWSRDSFPPPVTTLAMGLMYMCVRLMHWLKSGLLCTREQRSPWRQAPILWKKGQFTLSNE